MPPREELVANYEQGMNYTQLCEIYGVSPGTMSKWFGIYKIKARVPRVEKKVIDGKVYRKCFGPLHDETNWWVPIEKFWKNRCKSGGTQPRCVDCKGNKQRVKFTSVYQGWVISIVRRIGVIEAGRRIDVHDVTLRTWMGKERRCKPPETLQRHHAEAIVRVLGELKLTGEVRHRKSIKRGATIRGEKEREVKSGKDLYHRAQGNLDAEYKRQRRKQNPEIREKENQARMDRYKREQARLTDVA